MAEGPPIRGERLYSRACSPEVWQRSRKRSCGCFSPCCFRLSSSGWVWCSGGRSKVSTTAERCSSMKSAIWIPTFAAASVTSDPARFAKQVTDGTYHYLFEVTRVVAFIHWVSSPSRQEEQGMRPTLHKIYRPLAELVIAAMQVPRVFSVRLAILSLATPVFRCSVWWLWLTVWCDGIFAAGEEGERAHSCTTMPRRPCYRS